jgi:hypothetical protein
VVYEDNFFIAIMEQRNLAPDSFIIAFKRFLNGELCRDVACYVPTWHALNNFFTYTYKTVRIRFSYFLLPINEVEELSELLRTLGLKVLRIKNVDIEFDINGVLDKLSSQLNE